MEYSRFRAADWQFGSKVTMAVAIRISADNFFILSEKLSYKYSLLLYLCSANFADKIR